MMIITTDRPSSKYVNDENRIIPFIFQSIPEEIDERSRSPSFSVSSNEDWYVVIDSQVNSAKLTTINQWNEYSSTTIEPVHAEQSLNSPIGKFSTEQLPNDSSSSCCSKRLSKVSKYLRSFVRKHSHLLVGHYDFTRLDRTRNSSEPILLRWTHFL